MIKLYFLMIGMLINTNLLAVSVVNERFQIGESTVMIEVIQSNDAGLVFFHPHEDEKTSYKEVKKLIKQYGGKLVSIKQHGKRLIEVEYQGKHYMFDPNRMFTPQGIKDTLIKYSSFHKQVAKDIQNFADRIASLVLGRLVIAVHNNYDKGYNISSYKNSDKVKYYYQNPKQGTGEFFYTTNTPFFNFAKVAGYNAVVQSKSVANDGSFSVYAELKEVEYINLEVKRGEDSLEQEMLLFIMRYFANQYSNFPVKGWAALKQGDTIDLIAPSSATNKGNIDKTVKILESFGFAVSIKYAKSMPTKLHYANTDQYRADAFIQAMNNPDSQAVWVIKGGAGVTRLLPKLLKYPAPKISKPLIGFSDVTGLHNFVNQQWKMPSLHAIVADYNSEVDAEVRAKINIRESIKTVVDILLAQENKVLFYPHLTPMNLLAKQAIKIDGALLGGNLTLVQSTLDTPFQARLDDKILILEDIGNSAHQLERILDNIRYSQLLNGVNAIILGEFIQTTQDKKAVTDMIDLVLQRFANGVDIPVFRGDFFGHSKLNHPMPLNTTTQIFKNGNDFSMKVNIK
ncbi:MAG: LD-carboxypeptidase [Gammaproteobacteria bacterium]|nr:LD-carboxypeptidase [Gammaproteobacteria bacterium]